MFSRKFLLFLFVFIPLISCKADSYAEEGFQVWDQTLEINGSMIQTYIKFIDEDGGVVQSFYSYNTKDFQKKVVLAADGVIKDASGKILMDFSNIPLGFFGYSLKLSYPKNPIYTPGIIIKPYFGSGESVGDTFVIQWNYSSGTFELREYNLP